MINDEFRVVILSNRYVPIWNASTSGAASAYVELSASSASVHPFKFNHCIIQGIATRRGDWGGEQGKGEIAESPSLDVPESGKHPRPSKQTDRGSIVCSRKHACQYTLIITYRGEHPNTRIFADRGEEAEIRICCEHRCSNIRTRACVCLCASGGVRRWSFLTRGADRSGVVTPRKRCRDTSRFINFECHCRQGAFAR